MSATPKRVRVLDVPIDQITMDEAISRLEHLASGTETHLVITADASGIAQAQEDDELKRLYEAASLVTPDSQGVIWAARRSGQLLPERVSGVDIVDRVCRLSAEKKYRIFFLGAAPGVAAEAAEKLTQRYPGCNIVGTRHGYFSPSEDESVAAEVAAHKPDFLFVAMGIPRQEKFIYATRGIHRAKVGIGVGGSFDVFSGRVKRAPVLVQRLKLEWLWRTVSNPKKIKKAMMLPKFVSYVLRQRKPQGGSR